MPAELISRRDLDFQLYEWLDVEELTKRKRFADHSKETFDAILDLATQIAEKHFAPHAKKADEHEPKFDGTVVTMIPEVKAALDVYRESGLVAATMDHEYGGMQLPAVVSGAQQGLFNAANVGTAAYPFLTVGNSGLLLAHGSEE